MPHKFVRQSDIKKLRKRIENQIGYYSNDENHSIRSNPKERAAKVSAYQYVLLCLDAMDIDIKLRSPPPSASPLADDQEAG